MPWRKRQLNLVQTRFLFRDLSDWSNLAGVKVIDVESAAEMFEAVRNEFDDASIVIKSAAVADYRPKEIHPRKMKKASGRCSNRT